MKKLIILLSIVLFFGCTYTPIDENTEISMSILSNVDSKDSVHLKSYYVIVDDVYVYYFNSEKVLEQKYRISESDVSIDAFGLFIICIIFFGLGIFISYVFD